MRVEGKSFISYYHFGGESFPIVPFSNGTYGKAGGIDTEAEMSWNNSIADIT